MKRKDILIGLVAALLIAGALYRFSSDLPDGLQYVLNAFKPTPDKGEPKLIFGIPKPILAALGVIITFVLAFGLGRVISTRKNKNLKKSV